jgi:hypothetical protein
VGAFAHMSGFALKYLSMIYKYSRGHSSHQLPIDDDTDTKKHRNMESQLQSGPSVVAAAAVTTSGQKLIGE